jgi:hypothetical protein
MEDLNQSNHALDISEMSGIYLDPDELKKEIKSKAKTGAINDDNKGEDALKNLAAQPRKPVNKEHHEKLVKSIFEGLSRLRENINAVFEGDELDIHMKGMAQLSLLILELARCDLVSETAVGKEHEEEEYGLEVD